MNKTDEMIKKVKTLAKNIGFEEDPAITYLGLTPSGTDKFRFSDKFTNSDIFYIIEFDSITLKPQSFYKLQNILLGENTNA